MTENAWDIVRPYLKFEQSAQVGGNGSCTLRERVVVELSQLSEH